MDAETRAYLDELAAGITAQVAALASHMDRRFDALEQRMGALERRQDALEQRMAALEQRQDALEQRQDALEQRMGGLEQRQDALERRMEEGFLGVHEQFRTMKRGLEAFETHVATRFAAIDARLAEGERTSGGLRQDLDARIGGLERGMEDLRQAVASNTKRLEAIESQLGDIRADLVGVHGRLDSLSDDMRLRFRVLGDRVGGIERRLVA